MHKMVVGFSWGNLKCIFEETCTKQKMACLIDCCTGAI